MFSEIRFSNEAEKNDDSGEVRIPQTASCLQNSFEIGYRQVWILEFFSLHERLLSLTTFLIYVYLKCHDKSMPESPSQSNKSLILKTFI